MTHKEWRNLQKQVEHASNKIGRPLDNAYDNDDDTMAVKLIEGAIQDLEIGLRELRDAWNNRGMSNSEIEASKARFAEQEKRKQSLESGQTTPPEAAQ